eukprot:3686926-Rhodomonas_salina.1
MVVCTSSFKAAFTNHFLLRGVVLGYSAPDRNLAQQWSSSGGTRADVGERRRGQERGVLMARDSGQAVLQMGLLRSVRVAAYREGGAFQLVKGEFTDLYQEIRRSLGCEEKKHYLQREILSQEKARSRSGSGSTFPLNASHAIHIPSARTMAMQASSSLFLSSSDSKFSLARSSSHAAFEAI